MIETDQPKARLGSNTGHGTDDPDIKTDWTTAALPSEFRAQLSKAAAFVGTDSCLPSVVNPELVMGAWQRVEVALEQAPVEFKNELERQFKEAATKPLTEAQHELLDWLNSSPDGNLVKFSYGKSPSGSWVLKDGSFDVVLGPDPDTALNPENARSHFEMFLHETSHVFDGVRASEPERYGLIPGALSGYGYDWGTQSSHQILFREMRANYFASQNDFDQALRWTRTTYGIETFLNNLELTSNPDWVVEYNYKLLSGEQIYTLLESASAAFPDETIYTGDSAMKAIVEELLLRN